MLTTIRKMSAAERARNFVQFGCAVDDEDYDLLSDPWDDYDAGYGVPEPDPNEIFDAAYEAATPRRAVLIDPWSRTLSEFRFVHSRKNIKAVLQCKDDLGEATLSESVRTETVYYTNCDFLANWNSPGFIILDDDKRHRIVRGRALVMHYDRFGYCEYNYQRFAGDLTISLDEMMKRIKVWISQTGIRVKKSKSA